MIRLPHWRLRTLYQYLLLHDEETLLMKDIGEEVLISQPTLRKNLRWLESHGIIKRTGKFFQIMVR